MKKQICFVVALFVVMAVCGAQVSGAVIVRDEFTGGGDGTPITGRTPTGPNLPGGTWQQATSQPNFATTLTAGYGNPLPGSYGTSQNASAITLASVGLYQKPNTLRISAEIAPRNTAGSAAAGRGVALGYYSAVGGGQFSQSRFTGLILDAAGNLNLVSDPNTSGFYGAGSFLGTPVAFGGTFDPLALRTLTYDINTVTGAITNISLSGSTADYSSLYGTTLFTNAATAYAGMHTSSATGGTLGALDNFQVSNVEYYWDISGSAAGAGGTAPSGTWNGVNMFWNVNSAGTGNSVAVTTTSDNLSFSAGADATGSYSITLTGTQNAANLTFEDGNVSLIGAGTLNLGSASTITVNGALSSSIANSISGAATSLTKAGTGTLTLSGNNSYAGTTILQSGILSITNGGALGTTAGGTVQSGTSELRLSGGIAVGNESLSISGGGIANAGALRNFSGDNTWGGTVTMTAQSRINSDSGTLLLNNPVAVASNNFNLVVGGAGNTNLAGAVNLGTGGVIKDGPGTLTLSGTNNFTGVISFGGGIVNVASLSDYGVASAIGARAFAQESNAAEGIGLVFRGGTLQYTGSTAQSTNREIRIQTTGGTIDASGSNPNATLSFTHTGANINLFDTAGVRTLTLTGSNTGANTFAISLTNQAANATNLTKSGSGRWVLTGDSSYGGITLIQNGILQIEHSNALGAGGFATGPRSEISSGAALHLNGNLTLSEHFYVQGAGPDGLGAIRSLSGTSSINTHMAIFADTTFGVDTGSQLSITQQIYDFPVVNAFNVTKVGGGTLTLSYASNTYKGATQIQQGTLEATANGALGTAAAGTTVSSGARLLLSNTNYTTLEQLTLNGAGIGGASGALHATGNSRWDGNIDVASNATIFAPTGANLTLGTAASVINKNGTTLTFNGGGTFNVNAQVTGATDHTSDLDISGGSTVILNNVNNNYLGPTNIHSGTLQLGASSVVPNGSEVTFGSAGAGSTFNLASFNETVRGLSSGSAGAGVVRNSVAATSSTLTLAPQGTETWNFTGAIEQNPGTVNLVMAGAAGATQQLGGANTYAGTTTVSSGTLELTAGGSLQNATVAVNGGTFLQSGGTNNITQTGTGDHLTVASGATYTLSGGTLNFGDTLTGTQAAGNGASTLLIAGTFNFNDGILMNVTNIDPTGAGDLFTQTGGTLVVGVDGVDPNDPATTRATTNVLGNFRQDGGTLAIDLFGADGVYDGGEVGNFPVSIQTDSDLLNVTGDLYLDGLLAIRTNGVQPPAFGWYDVAFANTITLGSNFDLSGVGLYQVIDNPNGPGQILQVAAPEPAAIAGWALAALVGLGLFWRTRRRNA